MRPPRERLETGASNYNHPCPGLKLFKTSNLNSRVSRNRSVRSAAGFSLFRVVRARVRYRVRRITVRTSPWPHGLYGRPRTVRGRVTHVVGRFFSPTPEVFRTTVGRGFEMSSRHALLRRRHGRVSWCTRYVVRSRSPTRACGTNPIVGRRRVPRGGRLPVGERGAPNAPDRDRIGVNHTGTFSRREPH